MIKKYIPTLIEFTDWIEKFKKLSNDNDAFADALEPIIEYRACFNKNSEDLIVKLISRLMGDRFDWISWWIYENDWGKKGMKCYDKQKRKLKSKTISDLYNLIINDL